jgi:hypothetical protein
MTLGQISTKGLRTLAFATAFAAVGTLSVTTATFAQTASSAAVLPPVVAPNVAAAEPRFPGVLSAAPASAEPGAASLPPARPQVASMVPTGPYATVAGTMPSVMPLAGEGPVDSRSGLSALVLAGVTVLGLAGAAVERRQARQQA